MKHIQSLDEHQINEGSIDIKPGDIISFPSGKDMMALSTPTIKYSNKFPISFTSILISDLEKLKNGDKKGRRIYTSQTKEGAYKIIGKGTQKDVDLANNTSAELSKGAEEYSKKNYSQIEWDQDRRQYGATAQDGQKVFVGDSVMIRFSNGSFKGVIKQIAGTQTGEVMILFPGKSKGKGIKPERILSKI